ncbi:MAG TPA: hypothetical protein VL096_06480, partial [Pirellulaceae bacterium]|nr:hypothetical protein [Pirellulaceae bacterium]
TLDLKGRVACNRLNLNGRLPWDLSLTAWQVENLNFGLLAGALNISHYPVWLQQSRGMSYKPLLTIGPDSAEIVHHWHVWGQPVYVAGIGDSGLRWNLVDWRDNPRTASN